MYKVENNQTLCRIMKAFYQFGIWRNEDESDIRKMTRKLICVLVLVLFQIVLVTCACVSEGKTEFIFLLAIVIVVVVVIVKLLYLLWKKEEVLEFLYDDIVAHSTASSEVSVLISKKLNKFMIFIRAFILVQFVTIIFVSVLPLPIFSDEKKLPLFITFNLKWKYAEIIYWSAYICIIFGGLFSVISNLINLLIWYTMFNYGIEYQILGNQLRALGVNTTMNQKPKKRLIASPNSYERDLIHLIKHHRYLSEKIERFKSFYSTLFSIQTSTSGISICVATYNLTYNSHENLIQTEIFIFVLLYAIFDIFIVMYLGNEIMLGSDQLSYSLFESNWLEQSNSCKKCIIIMCEVLKQPQQLVILKLYPLNMETFMRILNGAYSMFNILKKTERN